jgi:hypothetical protein
MPSLKRILSPLEKFLLIETLWLMLKYANNRRRDKNLKSLYWLIKKTIQMFANRLKVVRKENSFAGEGKILQETMNKLEISGGYLVDIGAADGIRQSSTSEFLKNRTWKGALFEFNPESFSRLAFLYCSSDSVSLAKVKVTPDNVVKIFEASDVPPIFEYLNIDIDSYDLSILRQLLDAGYTPEIISMEINEKFPPNIYFEVLYSPEHYWRGDHFFGCSLTAAYETLSTRDYSLYSLQYNNAIFIRTNNRISPTSSLKTIYENGYLKKPDRRNLFPWNQNIEVLQSLDGKGSEDFINELFSAYSGSYRLELRAAQ